MGLLDPNTKDGRVIFFLPWQSETLAGSFFILLNWGLYEYLIYSFFAMYFAGTTDSNCSLSEHPKPTEKEVQFILSEIREYLSADVMGTPQISDALMYDHTITTIFVQ